MIQSIRAKGNEPTAVWSWLACGHWAVGSFLLARFDVFGGLRRKLTLRPFIYIYIYIYDFKKLNIT